ncbi:hypothetical protein OIU77_005732 [Salix suchowensis]|uniref:Uncharacterized protein n=1 Tax=Salix suchowensis TaxID=1278906 RepID=A0ABQ9ARM1_9ROSI|nr:hypothetical protein OIU77_005732 [Salix suchowensis]
MKERCNIHNTSCCVGYCCPALVMPAGGAATGTPGIWGGGSKDLPGTRRRGGGPGTREQTWK